MKEYNVVFTPDAEADMEGIYDHISDESGMPDVAITYVRKLRAACKKLKIAPIRGRNREDIRPNLRILALDKSAVAAFEVDDANRIVRILNIFTGGMDYEAIMEE